MKVMMQFIISVLGTVLKDLGRGLEKLKIGRRAMIIQTKALLRLTNILRRVL